MDRMILFLFSLFCVYSINSVNAQYVDTNLIQDKSHCDTISCGDYYLTIYIPEIMYKNKLIDYYEEGFFVMYPYKDSVYFFVHKGYNVTHPFCDTSRIKLIFEDDNIKCFFGGNNNCYVKEIYYKKRMFTMSYVNVKKEDVFKFDSIVSSLTIIPNQNEP